MVRADSDLLKLLPYRPNHNDNLKLQGEGQCLTFETYSGEKYYIKVW